MPQQRSTCTVENLSQRFRVPKPTPADKKQESRSTHKQYAELYMARNLALRAGLEAAAHKKWPSLTSDSMQSLTSVRDNERCCLIGTLIKKMAAQPSILDTVQDEYKFNNKHAAADNSSNFSGDGDSLLLEEPGQRIKLEGDAIDPGAFYTGTMVAVLGRKTERGTFAVEDWTYAGFPAKANAMPTEVPDEDRYVLMMSGLNIGGKDEKPFLTQMLLDYIVGNAGGDADHCFGARIVHVIVAGNSIADDLSGDAALVNAGGTAVAKYLTHKSEACTVAAMQELDRFVAELSRHVSVALMPGAHDVSNNMLPQKPLHSCLLPLSRVYVGSSLTLAPNPYECCVDGVKFLGTAGQNVNNMARYASKELNRLDILADTLKCRHLTPTAPDTLSCFPFTTADPFIIEETPNVYFCGNQPHLEHDVRSAEGADAAEEVRVLCVPDFSATGCVVLVNLKDLSCQDINVGCSLTDSPLR